MADPFQVVQQVFGSVGRWLNENRNNVAMYKRYGPMWRERLEEEEQARMFEIWKAKEDIRRSRTQQALNEQQAEKVKVEAAIKKGEFASLSEGMEPGSTRRESDPFMVEEGPGFKDVTAEQVYGRNYAKVGDLSEFERNLKSREDKREFLAAMDEHEKAMASVASSEASTEASQELANLRKFQQTDEYFEAREKFKKPGKALAGTEPTADMRNSAIVSEANRIWLNRLRKVDPEKLSPRIRNALFRLEGMYGFREWVAIPDDELDPFVLWDNRITYQNMKDIPSHILKEAKGNVQKDKDGTEAAGNIEYQDRNVGEDETPDMNDDEEDFERDVGIESSIRSKGGQNLTEEEQEYLRRLAEFREIK